jgi:hypothetical protein
MPDIVGVDTLLEGDPPEQAANFDGLALFAGKTQTDWENQLTNAELDRWGENGILGGLFAGLAEGKPFIAALIEAILIEVFPEYEQVVEDVEQAFADLASLFNGRWRDVVNAKNAADYANAQLAVSNRPIRDLFDGDEGNLSSTLWDIDYSDSVGGLAGGEVQQDGEGNAWWDGFGISGRVGRCRYKDLATVTDDQIVTIVMPLKVQPPALLTGQSYTRILLRVNATNDDYVYAEITDDDVKIGYMVGGTADEWASTSVTTQDSDVWDFFCQGTLFAVKRNGLVVLEYDDVATEAEMDLDHRFTGFEMFAESRGLLGQTSPGTIAVFSADDY